MAMRQRVCRLIDQLRHMWKRIHRITPLLASAGIKESHSPLQDLFHTLQLLLVAASDLKLKSSTVQKLHLLWAKSFIDVLDPDWLEGCAPIAMQLSHAIGQGVCMLQDMPALAANVEELVAPAVQCLRDSQHHWQMLAPSVQVRVFEQAEQFDQANNSQPRGL